MFSVIEGTKTLREAEKAAKLNDIDTLISISRNGSMCGRSKEGVWSVGLPIDIDRISNAIYYENSMKRKVGLWSEESSTLETIINELMNKIDMPIYPKDFKFLCHSTSLENIVDILKEKELKSLRVLKGEGKLIKTVRGKLTEPDESDTYVDFCTMESLSSEMVVAARQYEDIFSMGEIKYMPGVRMYFSLDELLKNENKVVDGLHALRIKERVSLEALKYIIFSSKEDLEKAKPFMDSTLENKALVFNIKEKVVLDDFVSKANMLVDMMESLKNQQVKAINMMNFINTYGVDEAKIINGGMWIKAKSDVYRNYILPRNEKNFEEILEYIGEEKAFCVLDDWAKDRVLNMGEIEWIISCNKYYFPIDKSVDLNKEFDIKRLAVNDASYIHDNYEFKDYISLDYIKERVEKEVAFGVYENGVLVGWVMTHDDGAIGLLNVIEEYRNKGYGEAVVRAIVKELLNKGKLPFAHIEDYNTKSSNLFKRIGMNQDGVIHWIKLK